MIIVYLFASLLGTFLTVAVLASYSWLLALLLARLGGSALALITAAAVHALTAGREALPPAAVAAQAAQ